MSWLSSKKYLYLWWLATITVLLYLAMAAPSAKWSSNITAALPGNNTAWQQLIQQNNSSRHLSLLLSGVSLAELQQAASQLQQEPITHLHWLQPGATFQQLQTLYQQHQALLVSPEQLAWLRSGQYQPLVDAAWQRLYSPSPLLENALQQDPLLLTQQYLEQQTTSNGLLLRPAWFELTTQRQPAILLYASLNIDPFERNNGQAMANALEQKLSQLQQQWPSLNIARSGVLFHAVVAAKNASFEMQLYGGISLSAILLLIWFSFANWRPLILALTTLGCASAFGLAAVLLLFEQPHVLGLVFATTLIGIAIDYSFHGMLAANKGNKTFKRMLPSLLLGLITTLLGYLALMFLPFPILNQVAVFMAVGLIVAFLTVKIVFLHWLPAASMTVNKYLLQFCANLSLKYNQAKPKWLLAVGSLALVAVSCSLLLQIQFNDDVRLFNQSPAELLQQEQQVRSAGGQNWDSRFIVLLGDSTEQLLQHEQSLQALLHTWQQQGKLGSWQATVQRVPPLQLQDEVQQLLQLAYQSEPGQDYLQQLQLKPPAAITKRLSPESFPSSFIQQIQPLNDKFASVILLSKLNLTSSDLTLLNAYPNTYWLDPIADTNASVKKLRYQLSIWLALALVLAIVILFWRRGGRAAGAIMLILVLAISSALLISLQLQQQLNIFNLIAALLVLALALDYGIFFTAKLPHQEVVQAVFLSATTSCLAFGLLAFSKTPAIASFGLTVFLGVALACILSPLLSVLAVKENKIHAAL
ncbi:hypothetical protein [Rheinheimera sp. MMS21-TC3]|uniref:MMPL family transporter n=1 Tax=Rheinheimera sp. MMS21-TC3 TaxID=3072790 RepID=UPI0028C3D865|nr:hypothetical protein [Rheinheimera sp. MMS21-TC3]WNO59540.1 hypothetical protein RDV63_00800 [Rheinheimera sp. MMS21-TC3]